MRLERKKPRHLLLSAAYRLNRFLPISRGRKLDFLLDLEWIANRLAHENAITLGLQDRSANRFLTYRISPDDRVLDVGCADGAILASITAKERVGIDYDHVAIERGKRDHPELDLRHGNALDLADTPFDVVILSHVLEHIDDPETLLRKIPADRIYIEVPDFEWSRSNRLRELRKRQLIYSDADHVFEFDRAEMEALIDRAGLTIDDREFRFGVMRYWVRKKSPPCPQDNDPQPS